MVLGNTILIGPLDMLVDEVSTQLSVISVKAVVSIDIFPTKEADKD